MMRFTIQHKDITPKEYDKAMPTLRWPALSLFFSVYLSMFMDSKAKKCGTFAFLRDYTLHTFWYTTIL